MRRYLALQAMESGKSIGSSFLGRAGGIPYGNGMLLNTDTSSSKVGMLLMPVASLVDCANDDQSLHIFPFAL